MTIRCVLMDIEGTILPIAFVREVLFSYARRRMPAFLQECRDHSEVRQWAMLCQDTIARERGVRPGYDDLAAILDNWMQQDRKHTGLKGLQGMLWEEGYKAKAFVPELYEDVFPMLSSWRGQGLRLALYSSGSEQAQRLLIAHAVQGNLVPMIEEFFDTRVGMKADASAYNRIADSLNLPTKACLFLSDIVAELDAAAAAGMHTTQIVRPGTHAGASHATAATLRAVSLAQPVVRDRTPLLT